VIRIRWTPAAADDLEEIHNYLLQEQPHLVQSTIAKLYNGIRALKDTPHLGRPGRIEGTRELLFSPLPYIATYRVSTEAIEILHIHHSARRHPE